MSDRYGLQGRPVALLGLARSGLATAKALMADGVQVWAWDDNVQQRAAATAAGVPLIDLTTQALDKYAALVISPGIPHTLPTPNPVATKAKEAGLPIFCDIELLARAQRGTHMVGITGTNGKSTTTALIGHILERSGRPVSVGGNLGYPVLSLTPPGPNGSYVLEMSSYQLELTHSLTFNVAIMLNASPDHLDRHGDMNGYVAAKRRIFDRQTAPQIAIVGVDDAWSAALYEDLKRQGRQVVVPISAVQPVPGGVYAMDGMLFDDTEGGHRPVMDLSTAPALPGSHNAQNAAAAYVACRASGIEPEAIITAIRSFPGLAHRQQLVALRNGVRFINDSKATNADAAAKALTCYDPIYWIVGGRPKEGGLKGLEPYMSRIAHAFLIGEAAEDFAQWLDGRAAYTRCGDLNTAVAKAADMALAEHKPGATVLLSPACASWDQFKSFEERGDVFMRAVQALTPEAATA